jgi:hypothetical protein
MLVYFLESPLTSINGSLGYTCLHAKIHKHRDYGDLKLIFGNVEQCVPSAFKTELGVDH